MAVKARSSCSPDGVDFLVGDVYNDDALGGYPFGDACLPKDLAASVSFAREQGLNPHLFKSVA